MPETYAAENEVPEVIWYFWSGAGRKMSVPGAASAIWTPRFEAVNRRSWASVPLTAITFGLAAGNRGGDFGPALPAAATSTTSRAAVAAMPRSMSMSFGPAKLMLMICAPCSTA
ncbi:hypothetical protein ES703_38383 [subsurface metagenome]